MGEWVESWDSRGPDNRDSRGTTTHELIIKLIDVGIKKSFTDVISGFILYHLTLKRFLAMKERSYEKSDYKWIEREKSALSEYLIRFRIAPLVFEISSFKER